MEEQAKLKLSLQININKKYDNGGLTVEVVT
jgi:hypothetical protein